MREVEPGHVHAEIDHSGDGFDIITSWSDGANNFGVLVLVGVIVEDVIEVVILLVNDGWVFHWKIKFM